MVQNIHDEVTRVKIFTNVAIRWMFQNVTPVPESCLSLLFYVLLRLDRPTIVNEFHEARKNSSLVHHCFAQNLKESRSVQFGSPARNVNEHTAYTMTMIVTIYVILGRKDNVYL